MGIVPGFAGQKLMETTFQRVNDLRELIDQTGSAATITVDGGVKDHNAAQLVDAGAHCLVMSSGIYGAPDPEASLRNIRSML